MKSSRIALVAGALIIILLLLIVVPLGVAVSDVISYTATGSETLNPDGISEGKALIVYDPGMSGNAKTTAYRIADHLRAKVYTVDVAGISSAAAKDVSGYDIVIIGGPIYSGIASSSVQAYLKDLKPSNITIVGVYGTGSVIHADNDPSIRSEVAPVQSDGRLRIKAVMKLAQGENMDKKCREFVNGLLLLP